MEKTTHKVNSMEQRGHWGSKLEFILSSIGFSVGLGTFWRFPYLCMRNGGGAFLIPYFIMLILCGLPMVFLEITLGQFSALSCVSVWNMCPLFKGLGWGMVILSAIYDIYHGAALAWILYFLGMSFRKEVPWKTCDNSWNTDRCIVLGSTQPHVNISVNITRLNTTGSRDGMVTAAEEFFNNKVLGLSSGIEHMGSIKWELALCLFIAWIIVFLCLCRGIKSFGKVIYVTATVPYLLLTIFLIRGATLPGSLNGIKYYIIPEWNRLAEYKVWTDACLHVFFSLGSAWGAFTTMSSYNKFHNNCVRDTLIATITNGATNLYAGFVIFSVLGFMAHSTGLNVGDVISQGPGLAFVAYPEAVSHLPLSPFWAVCLFLTLFTLAIDGEFTPVETVISGIVDEFPEQLRKRKILFTAVVCGTMFILGLPFVCNGGMYLFQIVDWYSSSFSCMVIGLFECLVISYIYGIGRYYTDLQMMLGRVHYVWLVLWAGITPLILLSLVIISAIQMVPPSYGAYKYPAWAIGMGWTLAMLSLVPIPCMAIYGLIKYKTDCSLKRMNRVLRPTNIWGPQEENLKAEYKYRFEDQTWLQMMVIRKESDLFHGDCVIPDQELVEKQIQNI